MAGGRTGWAKAGDWAGEVGVCGPHGLVCGPCSPGQGGSVRADLGLGLGLLDVRG